LTLDFIWKLFLSLLTFYLFCQTAEAGAATRYEVHPTFKSGFCWETIGFADACHNAVTVYTSRP